MDTITIEKINIISDLLNQKPVSFKQGELRFHCPFCNHHNNKLFIEINQGLWHCYHCDKGGHNIIQLAKLLTADKQIISLLRKLYSLSNKIDLNQEQSQTEIFLPKECIKLIGNQNKQYLIPVFEYLFNRKLTLEDIAYYNIQFCPSGNYANRIIIPSYNKNGQLNYFVARDITGLKQNKYKNPKAKKDIIFFENKIAPKLPIILVEGVFDAMVIKHNSIPLLGKTINKTLIEMLAINKPIVYLCLDNDKAGKSSLLSIYKSLVKIGINTILKVDIEDGKDPSELGYEKIWEQINKAKQINKYQLLFNGGNNA